LRQRNVHRVRIRRKKDSTTMTSECRRHTGSRFSGREMCAVPSDGHGVAKESAVFDRAPGMQAPRRTAFTDRVRREGDVNTDVAAEFRSPAADSPNRGPFPHASLLWPPTYDSRS
jgi:hypothetical protein